METAEVAGMCDKIIQSTEREAHVWIEAKLIATALEVGDVKTAGENLKLTLTDLVDKLVENEVKSDC